MDDNTGIATSAQQIVIAINKLVDVMTIDDASVTQVKLATGVAGTGPLFLAAGGVQSVANTTYTKLAASSETIDTAACYDSVTNYRFTPNVAGYYLVGGQVSFGNFTNNTNACAINKSGGLYSIGNTGALYTSWIADIVYMNGTSDYVELYGYQATGGAINTTTSSFWAALLRAAT